MTLEQLIELCRHRILYLNGVRASALRLGDVEQVDTIDTQISATQTTLNQLLTLV
jgi:hypothetical protein